MDAIVKDFTGLDGKRIVVVEDDVILAMDIAEQLRSVGARVLGPAPTIHYALQLIGSVKRPLDAAVLDINLHGQKVYELADVLHQRQVPFLFATAQKRETIPPRFQHAPVLAKPINPAELTHAIVELVRRPPPLPAAYPMPPPVIEEPVKIFARVVARTLASGQKHNF